MDTAFDMPPREMLRIWVPLVSLAVVLVLLTTAAVAWAGVALGGLPIAAAIALGAIVAPPDAAAASAVLREFSLPRRTMAVLQGESLLNDAVALLAFGLAVTADTAPRMGVMGAAAAHRRSRWRGARHHRQLARHADHAHRRRHAVLDHCSVPH